jgi:hypothetical protein
MSQQPWGQPQQPYQQQPPYGPPPYGQQPSGPQTPPPRPEPGLGAIIVVMGVILAIVVGIVVVIRDGDAGEETSSPAGPALPIATATASELTAEQRASIQAEAGIPPEPGAATTAAYIDALNAIDPDIVHGKTDKAVTRGRNQCSSFKDHTDRAKLVDLTNQRFISPDHPNGFGLTTASLILDVVHEHLCPTY